MMVVKAEPLEAITYVKVENGSFAVDPSGAQPLQLSELLKRMSGDVIVVEPCSVKLEDDPFLPFRQYLTDVL